jgi:hypothetical protein
MLNRLMQLDHRLVYLRNNVICGIMHHGDEAVLGIAVQIADFKNCCHVDFLYVDP